MHKWSIASGDGGVDRHAKDISEFLGIKFEGNFGLEGNFRLQFEGGIFIPQYFVSYGMATAIGGFASVRRRLWRRRQ